MNNKTRVLDAPNCPECGGSRIYISNKKETFEYGGFDIFVDVTLNVPVLECNKCEFLWTDWRGEEARTEATIEALWEEVQRLHRIIDETN